MLALYTLYIRRNNTSVRSNTTTAIIIVAVQVFFYSDVAVQVDSLEAYGEFCGIVFLEIVLPERDARTCFQALVPLHQYLPFMTQTQFHEEWAGMEWNYLHAHERSVARVQR